MIKIIEYNYFKTYRYKPIAFFIFIGLLIYLGIEYSFIIFLFICPIIFGVIEWVTTKRNSNVLLCDENKFIVVNKFKLHKRKIEISFNKIERIEINRKLPHSTIFNLKFILIDGNNSFFWFQKITTSMIETLKKCAPEKIKLEILSEYSN